MKLIVLIGRILFAALFLMAAPNHFTNGAVQYAASQGVPLAAVLVPISGILALLGGLSLLLGLKANWGAWLLVLFLLPVTFFMHRFWTATDPSAAQLQQIMFMKNLAMVGASLLVAYFGSGPLSVDSWLAARHHPVPAPQPATA